MHEQIDTEEFYQAMMQPEAPDEMDFALTYVHPEKDRTFSKEGLESVLDQVHAFVMARLYGRWKGTGVPPQRLTVHVQLDWEGKPGNVPFYLLDIETRGMTQADGEHRIPRG